MPHTATGKRRVVEVACAFCGGSGEDPFDIMYQGSRCCVCHGRGVVYVVSPHIPCAHCRGTGALRTLTCTACGGRGLLPAPAGPASMCPVCGGTGSSASIPWMDCLRCRGVGWVLTR